MSWAEASEWVRFTRDGGQCQNCGARQGDPAPLREGIRQVFQEGGTVRLVTAHVEDITDDSPDNLTTLCQACYKAHETQTRPQTVVAEPKKARKKKTVEYQEAMLFSEMEGEVKNYG